jgi:hypothetical protein
VFSSLLHLATRGKGPSERSGERSGERLETVLQDSSKSVQLFCLGAPIESLRKMSLKCTSLQEVITRAKSSHSLQLADGQEILWPDAENIDVIMKVEEQQHQRRHRNSFFEPQKLPAKFASKILVHQNLEL